MTSIAWFKELHRSDTILAGGKGADLGELRQGGFPVPDGFVITAEADLEAMDAAGVRSRLVELVAGVDSDDRDAVASAAAERLVRYGITSVSVNPDAVERTRASTARAERQLVLDALRGR